MTLILDSLQLLLDSPLKPYRVIDTKIARHFLNAPTGYEQ